MNRSKDLKDLFRKSLINKMNAPRVSPMYGGSNFIGGVHRVPGQYEREIQFKNDIRICFYEWSNITNPPRYFFQLETFDNFLKSCGIYMELYQREIISNLGNVYVSCYTGTRQLNIRSSYKSLLDSMNEYDRKRLIPNINNSNIQKPLVIVEPQNRWPENDGTFFG